jgi:hypothetical protein
MEWKEGGSESLVPCPCHARDASNIEISEFVKGRWREVKISKGATCTTVSDCDCNTFALICGCDRSATYRVVVGIDAVVTGEVVEKKVGDGGDFVVVVIRDTARTQASSVESALAGLGANQEAGQIAAATTVAAT